MEEFKNNLIKFKERLGEKRFKKFKIIAITIIGIAIFCGGNIVIAADDPLKVVNNLSDFIFGLIRAVGMIILAFAVVQIGLSIKSQDPTQRANGFLTFAGGLIITFAKEILKLITKG